MDGAGRGVVYEEIFEVGWGISVHAMVGEDGDLVDYPVWLYLRILIRIRAALFCTY